MKLRRPWLMPLVPLYAAGLAWKNRAFDRDPARAQRLADPVISVGSLSAGGAGKTPFVIALGEALRRAGYGIDVLSRGHGRTSTLDLRVDPYGSVNDFGDEPLLLARQLACPVYVARERYRAGQMAERDRRVLRADRHLSLHLLDDGFQHRQLQRAVDIVLLTAEDAADTLLPAGNLREPLRALRRADVIALRHEEADGLQPLLQRVLGNAPAVKVWTLERRTAVTSGAATQRPFAFCGLARPADVLTTLAKRGISIAGHAALRDHQRYSPDVIQTLIHKAQAVSADGFITTAKDAVKLTDDMRRQLQTVGPLAVCDVVVTLADEAQCVRDVMGLVEAGWQRRLQP